MRKNGLTLVEFLIIMAIVVILAAIIVPNLRLSHLEKTITNLKTGQPLTDEDTEFLEKTLLDTNTARVNRFIKKGVPENVFESTQLFNVALTICYKDPTEKHLSRQVFWFTNTDNYKIDPVEKTITITKAAILGGQGGIRVVKDGTFSYVLIISKSTD